MPNKYFIQLAEAKAENKESFKYNGKTYTRGKTKTGMTVYRGEKKEEVVEEGK